MRHTLLAHQLWHRDLESDIHIVPIGPTWVHHEVRDRRDPPICAELKNEECSHYHRSYDGEERASGSRLRELPWYLHRCNSTKSGQWLEQLAKLECCGRVPLIGLFLRTAT